MTLINQVLECIKRYSFVTQGFKPDNICQKSLYVACSGGRDSLVLAHLCICLYRQGKLPKPILIHINHNLQACSGAWAKGVDQFAQSYGVPCHIIDITLTDTSEQGARQARYQAFLEAMADGDVLFLAHHQDDQAETLLMRLINGTGIKGLGGMRVWQPYHQDTHHQNSTPPKTIYLFRPLLAVSRADISAYADAHALPYIDDPTNDTGDNVRAIFRREIMPIFRQINPKASANIARSASLAVQSHNLLERYVLDKLNQCLINTAPTWQCTINNQPYKKWQTRLDIGRLLALDAVSNEASDGASDELSMAVLHAFIQGDEPYSASYDFVCRVKALCQKTTSDHQTELFWQGQMAWVLVRYDGVLYRYHQAVWHALQGQMNAHIDGRGLSINSQDGRLRLLLQDPLIMHTNSSGLMNDKSVVIALTKTDKISVNPQPICQFTVQLTHRPTHHPIIRPIIHQSTAHSPNDTISGHSKHYQAKNFIKPYAFLFGVDKICFVFMATIRLIWLD